MHGILSPHIARLCTVKTFTDNSQRHNEDDSSRLFILFVKVRWGRLLGWMSKWPCTSSDTSPGAVGVQCINCYAALRANTAPWHRLRPRPVQDSTDHGLSSTRDVPHHAASFKTGRQQFCWSVSCSPLALATHRWAVRHLLPLQPEWHWTPGLICRALRRTAACPLSPFVAGWTRNVVPR